VSPAADRMGVKIGAASPGSESCPRERPYSGMPSRSADRTPFSRRGMLGAGPAGRLIDDERTDAALAGILVKSRYL